MQLYDLAGLGIAHDMDWIGSGQQSHVVVVYDKGPVLAS